MNDTGRALLVNAIAYIARFTDDRPIVHTPCVFVQGKRLVDRDYLAHRLRQPKPDLSGLPYFFAKADFEKHLKDKSVEDVAAWYRQERDYLHADADGKLTVDADARRLRRPAGRPRVPGQGVGGEFAGWRAADARRTPRPLRARRSRREGLRRGLVGVGREEPGVPFFSDTGGYRWYLDPLARARDSDRRPARRCQRRTISKTADTRTKSASLDYRRAIWRVVCPIRGRDLPAGSQARFLTHSSLDPPPNSADDQRSKYRPTRPSPECVMSLLAPARSRSSSSWSSSPSSPS